VFRRDALGQAPQTILIERCGQLVDELALIGDQQTSTRLRLRSSPTCNMMYEASFLAGLR
jgi:hypothetical protein